MPYSVTGFLKIYADMVDVGVLLAQDSDGEDLFCDDAAGTRPSLLLRNYLFGFRFKSM